MALDEKFTPPVLPQSDNSSGLPQPPSGVHEASNAPTEFIPTGPGWVAPVPAGADTNIHGTP
jgi:hypothetical protein